MNIDINALIGGSSKGIGLAIVTIWQVLHSWQEMNLKKAVNELSK